jgi:FkbM family methyltransferase
VLLRGAVVGAVVVAAFVCAAAYLSLRRAPDDIDELLTSGEKLYSQHNEELIIRHFFRDRRGGFFLDVGSGHFEKHSTTYYLEKHLGWSGIGIDAVPDYAADYALHRPHTEFINLLVSDHSGSAESFYKRGHKGNWGLSSTEPVLNRKGRKWRGEKVEIPTTTLTDLLDERGVHEIDFLSMDIEGAELKALAGFDIERFAPRLVCIESVWSEDNRDAIANYFATHQYELIEEYRRHDRWNWYMTPKQQ